jgi:hypothetical protein
MTHGPVGVEIMAIPAGDSGRFLAAMLECMESESDHGRCRFRAGNAENPTFFAQLVVVERMRCEHDIDVPLLEPLADQGRPYGWPYRRIRSICRPIVTKKRIWRDFGLKYRRFSALFLAADPR